MTARALWETINRRSACADAVAVALFALLTCVGMMHHEPWMDEADTWLVARDDGLRDMLLHHLRYVGSPGLWYLMLAPFAKSGLPYLAQPILNWFIAVAAAMLFMWRAPFPRAFKLAFLFSVHMAYQYSVIARSSALSIFLLFCVAALYPRRFERPYLYALPVVLLAHTQVMVFPASVALMLGYLWEITRRHFVPSIHHYAAGALMGFGILLAALTVYPQPDDLWLDMHRIISLDQPFSFFLSMLQGGFFPTRMTWEDVSFLHPASRPVLLLGAGALGGCIILGASFYSLRRKTTPLLFLALSTAWMFYLFGFKYGGGVPRHFGFFPIFCLVACWIGVPYPPRSKDRAAERFAILALGLALAASFPLMLRDQLWDGTHPYSGGKAAAGFIREQGYEQRTVVAYSATAGSMMPYLPNTRFWMAISRGYASYNLWSRAYQWNLLTAPDHFRSADIDKTRKNFSSLHDLVIVTPKPIDDGLRQAEGLRLLYEAPGGIESFWLYEFAPAAKERP